jgi:AhpC/TSA family protein
MRKVGISAALAVLLAFSSIVPPLRADQPTKPEMKLKVGDMAPDFKMQYFDGHDLKDVTLSEYRGKKNVVLAFYIFAFTGG